MTTMIKSTPEEQLEFGLQEVAQAKSLVAGYTEAQEKARRRAETTTGLAKAAQLAFSNADAKYRVLFESAETAAAKESAQQARYSYLKEQHTAVTNELTRATQMHTAVGGARQALADAIDAARTCDRTTREAAQLLRELATGLGKTEYLADPKTALAGVARQIREQRTRLENIRTTKLDPSITKANDEYLGVPALPELQPLIDREKHLAKQLAAAAPPPHDEPPAIDPADLRQAKGERDTALTALVELPQAERKAQADLQAAQGALADAQNRLDTANQARDEVERSIIARIDIGRPDATGLVEVTAVFVTGSPPKGYDVHWTVDVGELRESVGTVVHLETQGITASRFTVEAHLERK